MPTIDLIVLGIIKQQTLSAYDIQKLVEYRNISKWVKISTPSIYKKVIQLEEKGLIKGKPVKQTNMAEKMIYSLTPEGEKEFIRLADEISRENVNIFLDFNAVIVNIESLPPENRVQYIRNIKANISNMKNALKNNLDEKENLASIPKAGLAVLTQQYMLATTIEKWLNETELL